MTAIVTHPPLIRAASLYHRAQVLAVRGYAVTSTGSTPLQAAATLIRWISAGRLRRVVLWPLVVSQLAILTMATLAPTAAAATAGSGAAAVSWMNVSDSHGVNAAQYMFSTDHGSFLHPTHGPKASFLDLEFGTWLVLAVGAVWFIGWALSFNWLTLFSTPITAVSDSITQTISSPAILGLAATVAAIPIAFFFLFGHWGKGVTQLCAILLIAVLSTSIFAHPVADVMGPDGLLSTGRDAGISFSQNITHDRSTNAADTIASIEGQLTDSFIRAPLQAWNFGQSVDNAGPACASAWDAGQRSGDEDRVKDAVRDCGAPQSRAMKKIADNPSGGQLGTGVALLLFSLILLAFGVYFGGKIIYTGMSSVYYAIRSIIGFAATGYVHGSGQRALWHDIVDAFMAAVQMGVYVVLLSVYAMVLHATFARVNGFQAIVVGAILMVVGMLILRKVGESFRRGTTTVAAKIATSFGGPSTTTAAPTPMVPGLAGHALNAAQAGARAAGNHLRSDPATSTAPDAGRTDGHTLPASRHTHHGAAGAVKTAVETAALAIPGVGEVAAAADAVEAAKAVETIRATQRLSKSRHGIDIYQRAVHTQGPGTTDSSRDHRPTPQPTPSAPRTIDPRGASSTTGYDDPAPDYAADYRAPGTITHYEMPLSTATADWTTSPAPPPEVSPPPQTPDGAITADWSSTPDRPTATPHSAGSVRAPSPWQRHRNTLAPSTPESGRQQPGDGDDSDTSSPPATHQTIPLPPGDIS